MNMIQIRRVEDVDELRQCVRIQESTWGPGFSERVPVTMLHLCLWLGGYAAGAFERDEMVGFVFGLPGIIGGDLIHWSDMLAVLPDWRGRGIGLSLKRHQREALLERGVTRVYWTFEPLEARNAYLNIARLGATAREYVRDFYGASDSPLHHGIGTDRLIAVWDITSPRVEDRLAGRGPAGRRQDRASAVRIVVPADIQRIKRHAPERATEWRESTRAAFERFFARGYVAGDFVRTEDGGGGFYVLTKRIESADPVSREAPSIEGSMPRARPS